MVSLDWTELGTITEQIRRLQAQRIGAKQKGDVRLAQMLSNELERTEAARATLIWRIATRIGRDDSALTVPVASHTLRRVRAESAMI